MVKFQNTSCWPSDARSFLQPTLGCHPITLTRFWQLQLHRGNFM